MMNKIFSNPMFISLLDNYSDMTGFITLDRYLNINRGAGMVNPQLLTSYVTECVNLAHKYNLFNVGILDQNDLHILTLITSGILLTNNVQDQTLLANITKFTNTIAEANKMANYVLGMILN